MTKLLSCILAAFIFVCSFETIKIIKLHNVVDELSAEIAENEKIPLEEFVVQLKSYDVFDKDGPIKLYRHGRENDGGYVVPEIAFVQADALIGYGVADDISFEEQFSDKYNKPSFGFDCGVDTIKINNKKCTFVKECIANDKFVYTHQKSSGLFSSFDAQLKKLKLQDKKVFVKMDIEGAEYEAFDGIFKHSSNVTGIVLELHFQSTQQILLATKLLANLQKDFYLIHVHGNNCCSKRFTTKYSSGEIPRVLEITFINKSLVTRAVLSEHKKYPLPIDMKNSKSNSKRKAECKFEIF